MKIHMPRTPRFTCLKRNPLSLNPKTFWVAKSNPCHQLEIPRHSIDLWIGQIIPTALQRRYIFR
jgi:hypothetical protein